MKDIKELIYAAVEENAVAFQELAGNILQARAYDAIEALRPEVGASMFGEAKECACDDEEEDGKKPRKSKVSDEDDSKEEVDESAIDEASAQARQNKESKRKLEAERGLKRMKDTGRLNYGIDTWHMPVVVGRKMAREEVEQIEEKSEKEVAQDLKVMRSKVDLHKDIAANRHKYGSFAQQNFRDNPAELKAAEKGLTKAHKDAKKTPVSKFLQTRKGDGKVRTEEVEQIDEVEHPKSQMDMLAHILHQVKVSGHPVATDAQFRATHGKDKTKKASLEPGQDKVQYAIAQGGNVKP
jgi:hypothetical protein